MYNLVYIRTNVIYFIDKLPQQNPLKPLIYGWWSFICEPHFIIEIKQKLRFALDRGQTSTL